MNETICTELNSHLALEFEAEHNYLAMSLWLELHDLPGFANWMAAQSRDERAHAQRIIDHLLERGERPVIPAVERPVQEWENVLQMITQVLESERRVTASVDELYDLAGKHNDRAAQIMLQWFVNEQVEEENVVQALLGRLRLAGESGVGLLMIDQELGKGQVPGARETPNA